MIVRDAVTGIADPDLEAVFNSETGSGSQCDHRVFVKSDRPDWQPYTLYTIELYDAVKYEFGYPPFSTFDYFGCQEGSFYDSSFYCPYGGVGNPDLAVVIRYEDNAAKNGLEALLAPHQYISALGAAGIGVADFFSDENWMIPYNLDVVNSGLGTDLSHDIGFFITGQNGPLYTTTAEADLVLYAAPSIAEWDGEYDWAETTHGWAPSDRVLRFPAGRKLVVEGDLTAEGAILTEADEGQGWGGIRFEPGSNGLVESSVIERVRGPNGYDGTAIYIDGASPTIRNSFVLNSANYGNGATGIYVTGSDASPLLEGNRIEGINGDGIVLTGGADARLIQNDILNNDGLGFVASGSGTEAFLSPPFGSDPANGEFGNVIDDNNDGGVYATSSAHLTLGYYYYGGPGYHADGFNSVTGNGGVGLSASYNGRIAAGNTTNQQRNRLFGNATHDAEAVGTGSRVWASCDWWNDTSPPFRTAESGGGIVDDAYYLLADPYVDPDAACVGGGTSFHTGTATQERSAVASSEPSSSGRGDTPRGLLIAAAEAIDQNPVAALALLGQVIEQADDETLAAVALAEADYVLARADLPESVRANAEALLDAAVTGSQPALRAAALRALVAVRQVRGDGAGALYAATALVEGATSPADVFFGHLARVYLYAEAGQEAEAWVALAEVEAREPESIEAVLARRHLEGPGGAGGEGRSAPRAAVPTASSEAKAADAAFRLDPVYPNPTRRAGTVSFALSEADEVRLTVYDVLGREVSVLADGAFEAGAHEATLDTSVLPSGVYLVRLAAGDHVATRQITVLR